MSFLYSHAELLQFGQYLDNERKRAGLTTKEEVHRWAATLIPTQRSAFWYYTHHRREKEAAETTAKHLEGLL